MNRLVVFLIGSLLSVYLYAESLEQDLYLDITLNQLPQKQIGHFIETADKTLLIDRATLNDLALKTTIPDDIKYTQFVNLKEIKGLSFHYDESQQKIELQVTANLLNANTQINSDEKAVAAVIHPEQMRTGVILNYDIYQQYTSETKTLNAWNEMRFFGAENGGVFSLSSNFNYVESKANKQTSAKVLDAYWQQDFQDKAISLVVGDSHSTALNWTRSSRISGIKVEKNFTLQPYQITSPIESFKGNVVLPSRVDLLINGLKQSTAQVPPGDFTLQAVPKLTGSGVADLVITDLNGQQRTVSFNLFGSSKLLKAGLSNWSASLGVSKLDYAIKSFHYDKNLLFNGSYRYGLTQHTTLESHAEYGRKIQNTGVGVVQRLPWQLGVFNSSYSYSQFNGDIGQFYTLGYEWSNDWFNLSLNHQKKQGNFGDIGSTFGYDYLQNANQVFLGVNTAIGQLGTSYTQQKSKFGENQFLMFSWSRPLFGQNYLSLNTMRDLTLKKDSVFLSLNIAFDRKNYSTVSLQNAETQKMTSGFRRVANQAKDDWGWQVNTDINRQKDYTLQAQLQRYNSYGEWNVGLQQNKTQQNKETAVTATVRGGLLAFNGHLFATRQSLGAFAVVSTNGIADIPISYENRAVGKTNQKGLFLIDYLNPYQHNTVAINALGIPLDYKIETTKVDAVPYQRTGLWLDFSIYPIKFLQMKVVDDEQQDIAMGSVVWNQSQLPKIGQPEHTIVGRDGIIFLENPKGNTIYIQTEKLICKLELPEQKQQSGFIDIGTQVCH